MSAETPDRGSDYYKNVMAQGLGELPRQARAEKPDDWKAAAQEIKIPERAAREDTAELESARVNLEAAGISAGAVSDKVIASRSAEEHESSVRQKQRDRHLRNATVKAADQKRTLKQLGVGALATLSILAGYLGVKSNHEVKPLGDSPIGNSGMTQPDREVSNDELAQTVENNMNQADAQAKADSEVAAQEAAAVAKGLETDGTQVGESSEGLDPQRD